jgi:uncharacterized protein YndB with AHSA1/START domain
MNTIKTVIKVEAKVNASIEKVWECFTQPQHVVNWNFAHESWHCPNAVSDLKVGGRFNYRMDARDGSFGFDFCGTFTKVEAPKHLAFKLDDDRMVDLSFLELADGAQVIEEFEAESENSIDLQREGWQAILNNFKRYTEGRG